MQQCSRFTFQISSRSTLHVHTQHIKISTCVWQVIKDVKKRIVIWCHLHVQHTVYFFSSALFPSFYSEWQKHSMHISVRIYTSWFLQASCESRRRASSTLLIKTHCFDGQDLTNPLTS